MTDTIRTDFVPKCRDITAVTLEQRAQVTTSADHTFTVGQYLAVHVPRAYGMELDGVVVTVYSVPSSTEVILNLDTTEQAPFVTPADPYTPAHICPVSGTWYNNTSITGASGA